MRPCAPFSSALLGVLCVSALSLFYVFRFTSMKDSNRTHAITSGAIEIRRNLGPGLLEAVYEECLVRELALLGIPFERQKPIPLVYKDLKLECGYRLDFRAAGRVVVQLNSIEALAPRVRNAHVLAFIRMLVGSADQFPCAGAERWHTPLRMAL